MIIASSFAALISPLSSSIYLPSLDTLARDMDVSISQREQNEGNISDTLAWAFRWVLRLGPSSADFSTTSSDGEPSFGSWSFFPEYAFW